MKHKILTPQKDGTVVGAGHLVFLLLLLLHRHGRLGAGHGGGAGVSSHRLAFFGHGGCSGYGPHFFAGVVLGYE